MGTNRLLIIEDDQQVLRLATERAARLGFEVTPVFDPREFRDALRSSNPTAILLDLSLPTLDGIEIVRYLGKQRSQARLALMSGHGSRVLDTARRAAQAEGLNVVGIVGKPFGGGKLEEALISLRHQEAVVEFADLQEAINQRQFVLRYQPKAQRSSNGELVVQAVEALVRWNHPELGILSPAAFLPMAEGSDLIFPLSSIVLETALRDQRVWQEENLDLSVAVNFSPRLLSDWDLPNEVSRVLELTGVAPEHLTLEITERGITEDPVQAMEVLTRLRLRGVGVSLDDFGTGNATLIQLLRMPFSEVKLDRSVFASVEQTDQERSVVTSLVKMFHYLQLDVCAEGLETQEALQMALDVGCDLFQGYYLGRPMPPEELPTFIATRLPQMPASTQPEETATAPILVSAGPATQPRGEPATILLVEDQEALRRMIVRTLKREGNHVLSAPDGAAALELARQHNGEIDLLLTDVVLPRLGGRELAAQLSAERPGLRVLYMSGYTNDSVVSRGLLAEDVPLIEKPFALATLARTVRQALAVPRPTDS